MLVLTQGLDRSTFIHHAGETLRIVVCGFNQAGSPRIGYEGPESFVILRENAKKREPVESSDDIDTELEPPQGRDENERSAI